VVFYLRFILSLNEDFYFENGFFLAFENTRGKGHAFAHKRTFYKFHKIYTIFYYFNGD